MAGRAPPSSVVYQIIERARKKLKHVYGFDIIEAESNSISDEVSTQASQGAKAGIKVYMLRNVLKYPIDEEGQQQEQGGDEDEEDEEMKQKRLERRVAEERAKILGLGEAPNPTPHYHLALCLMTAICLQRYSMTEKELWALMDKMGLQKSTQVITSIRTRTRTSTFPIKCARATNKLAGKCTACVAARNLACGWVAKESGKSPRSSNTQLLLRNGVAKAWKGRQALHSGPSFSLHHRVLFPALLFLFFLPLKSSFLLRQNHRTFGKVEDAVKEIVAQGYLHVKKSKDRDGQPQVKRMKAATNASSNIPVLRPLFPSSQINYCLGLRGEGEVTRLRMLNWAEHVFDEKMLSSTRSVPRSMNTGRLTHPFTFYCMAWEDFSSLRPCAKQSSTSSRCGLRHCSLGHALDCGNLICNARLCRDDLLDTGADDDSDDE